MFRTSLGLVAIAAALATQPTFAQGTKPAATPPITALPIYRDPAAIPLSSQPSASATPENWDVLFGGRIVRNVTAPTLTPFLPDPKKATGAAVIVAPGGGFMMLSIDSEGYAVARWLADHGIAAFVLKYRLKPTPADSQEYLKYFMAFMGGLIKNPPNTSVPPIDPEPLADAQAAVRLVRSRAAEWRIDPTRVGFVGFSAGAFTTLAVGLSDDKASRPDFIAPIYGPLSSRPIPADAPPMFAAMASDDPIFGGADFALLREYRAAGRPLEFHLYDKGGHGFGMNKQGTTSDLWIDQFYAWMKERKLLGAK